MSDAWGCDTPISMPEPPASAPLVRMEGMAFSIDGMVHPITEEEREEISRPTYAPRGQDG